MAAPNPNAPDLIEDYLDSREPFARPILVRLRAMIHQAHPEIVEDWKWRCPAFRLNDRNVFLLGGFKGHASLVFSDGAQLHDWAGLFDPESTSEIIRVARFKSEKELDPGVLFDYFARACEIAAEGKKPDPAGMKKPVREVAVPEMLAKALRKEKAAAAFFEGLSPSYRREYCGWISDAKQDATQKRRLERTLEFLRAGKKRPFG